MDLCCAPCRLTSSTQDNISLLTKTHLHEWFKSVSQSCSGFRSYNHLKQNLLWGWSRASHSFYLWWHLELKPLTTLWIACDMSVALYWSRYWVATHGPLAASVLPMGTAGRGILVMVTNKLSVCNRPLQETAVIIYKVEMAGQRGVEQCWFPFQRKTFCRDTWKTDPEHSQKNESNTLIDRGEIPHKAAIKGE